MGLFDWLLLVIFVPLAIVLYLWRRRRNRQEEMQRNPFVSILTPTGFTHYGHDRSSFLPLIYECVRKQEYVNFEWIVLDVRPHASPLVAWSGDDRVRYIHEPSWPMSLGTRRNKLCCEARGEIIAMFDDDDYYAPCYLAQMVSLLTRENVDIVKLFGFFVFKTAEPTRLSYWDLSRAKYEGNYSTTPHTDVSGFGFSYVFRKEVWKAGHYPPDKEHGEDQIFIDRALQSDFKLFGIQDEQHHSCLHVLHGGNISSSHPRPLSDDPRKAFPTFPGDAYVEAAARPGHPRA